MVLCALLLLFAGLFPERRQLALFAAAWPWRTQASSR